MTTLAPIPSSILNPDADINYALILDPDANADAEYDLKLGAEAYANAKYNPDANADTVTMYIGF